MKVLLVGNSQIFYNDLPQMLAVMTESAPPGHPRLDISKVTIGGAGLAEHWEAGEGVGSPRAMIAQQQWDWVVIQEIFCATRESFEKYGKLLDDAIRKAGSKTMLLATAQVTKQYVAEYSYPDSFNTFNGMQLDFGKKYGITVAPAGYAWMRYLGGQPTEAQILDLYHQDKGHPGRKGSYIYACLLYAAITGQNPAGLAFKFPGIPGEDIPKPEAEQMQKAAWDQWKAIALA